MCMLLLLCLIVWTLQSMHQDKREEYIQQLCNDAHKYAQADDFEKAFHWYNSALQFYMRQQLNKVNVFNKVDVLCHIWTQLGNLHYTRWLEQKTTADLAGAVDNFRKAKEYNYMPALEKFGVLSMKCGNFEQAIQYLEIALNDNLNIIKNSRRVAICYKEIGDHQRATVFFHNAYMLGDAKSLKLLYS